ncbi:hypothetical protein ACH5RR_027058 [Cinchona calisaya]|uniref:Uncharacterized protein n=1 Tax=Cinchona calisaya TaxID=153742 RepID=A0ABD2Z4D9_9GENT
MGRAPCCDKANVKKGPWSPEEDAELKSYIEQHGTGGNWIALPQKMGLKRCGKSCRLRWLNYLRPNIKHGGFSEEEDKIICSLYISIGSRWSIIAAQLPGRTDNDIKNYWNTRLKKKLLGKQRKEQHARRNSSSQTKQEMLMRKGMMRENINNQMVSSSSSSSSDHNSIINQNPFWPHDEQLPVLPPIPYSNQEPSFNDHAYFRKLLIKLGGKFSDNDDQQTNGVIPEINNLDQYSLDDLMMYHQQQQISMISAADPVDVLNSTSTLAETKYNMDGNGIDVSTLQGPSSFEAELIEQMMYNDPQKLDGLEFLCGGNSDWGEMNSLILPPVVNSNYVEGLQQGMLQECAFDQLRYLEP